MPLSVGRLTETCQWREGPRGMEGGRREDTPWARRPASPKNPQTSTRLAASGPTPSPALPEGPRPTRPAFLPTAGRTLATMVTMGSRDRGGSPGRRANPESPRKPGGGQVGTGSRRCRSQGCSRKKPPMSSVPERARGTSGAVTAGAPESPRPAERWPVGR